MIIFKFIYHFKAAIMKIIYRIIFGNSIHFGNGVTFRNDFTVYLGKGAIISVGDRTFFNHGCSLNALENITIGKDCLFGENVKVYDQNHEFSNPDIAIAQQGFNTAPITIGDNCWICSNVVILRGVTIGNHCVVGAGCVISHNLPDNSIVKCVNTQIIESVKK